MHVDLPFLASLGLAVTIVVLGVDWAQNRAGTIVLDTDKLSWGAVGGMGLTCLGCVIWMFTTEGVPRMVAVLLGFACIGFHLYAIHRTTPQGFFAAVGDTEDQADSDGSGGGAPEPEHRTTRAGAYTVGDDARPVEKIKPGKRGHAA